MSSFLNDEKKNCSKARTVLKPIRLERLKYTAIVTMDYELL